MKAEGENDPENRPSSPEAPGPGFSPPSLSQLLLGTLEDSGSIASCPDTATAHRALSALLFHSSA